MLYSVFRISSFNVQGPTLALALAPPNKISRVSLGPGAQVQQQAKTSCYVKTQKVRLAAPLR